MGNQINKAESTRYIIAGRLIDGRIAAKLPSNAPLSLHSYSRVGGLQRLFALLAFYV